MVASALALEDATPLAHAYAHAIAAEVGVRILSIKGPVAEHHAVRPARTPADADVLVDPGGFVRFIARLRAASWRERPTPAEMAGWATHSVTLIHDGWPCDLDAHVRFPGFLSDPGEVFDVLWSARDTIIVAGRPTPVPNRDATILITALHSLRGSERIARHDGELAELRARLGAVFTDDDRDGLASLARATGCVETLDGALRELGVPSPVRDERRRRQSDPALHAWRERVGAGSIPTYFWLQRLQTTPWRARPRMLLRIIWPDDELLRRSYPELAPGRAAANRVQVQRLGRGIRDLPRVLRARASARRCR